jgi:hypothetical protein
MEAKLTLKLDKTTIDSAKKYAENNNRSLSRLVENYFRNLSVDYVPRKRHSPLVESLSGILSEGDLEKFAYEDDRARYILERKT